MHTAHIFGKVNSINGIISVVMLKRCPTQYWLLISRSKWNFLTRHNSPQLAKDSSFSRIHDHTQTHQTRYDSSGRVISPTQSVYLTTYNIHDRQTSTTPEGFEPAIPASERPQTHVSDRAVTGTAIWNIAYRNINLSSQWWLHTANCHLSLSIDLLFSSPFSATASCTFLWSSSFPTSYTPIRCLSFFACVRSLWFSRNT